MKTFFFVKSLHFTDGLPKPKEASTLFIPAGQLLVPIFEKLNAAHTGWPTVGDLMIAQPFKAGSPDMYAHVEIIHGEMLRKLRGQREKNLIRNSGVNPKLDQNVAYSQVRQLIQVVLNMNSVARQLALPIHNTIAYRAVADDDKTES